MCRRILLSLWVAVSAVAAYWLPIYAPLPEERLLLLRWAPPALTFLLSVLLSLPEKDGCFLSEMRPLPAAALQGGGALLLAFSGGHQLYVLYGALRSLDAIVAASLILAGIGLLGGMKACEGGDRKSGSLLLLPLAAVGLHIVTAYFDSSANPIVRSYDMRILFLAMAAISVALLGEFVFDGGRRRFTVIALSLTVTFAGGALHMAESLPQVEGIMGVASAAFGFLLSMLFGFDKPARLQYELVEDPFSTGRIRTQQETPVREDPPEVKPASETEPAPEAKPAAEKAATEPSADTAQEEAFDLARVDRLLLELELDTEL